MLTIRQAVSDADYSAYREVRIALEPGQRIPTIEDLRSFERPGRHTVLAEVDGQVVGCGIADRSDSVGRAHVQPRIAPQFQRRGYGTELLYKLCELAEPLGFPTAGALADDPGSVAFGLRHGFTEVDRQVEQVRPIEDELPVSAPDGVEIVSIAQRPELWLPAYDAVGAPGFADMAASREVKISREQWEKYEMNEPAATFLALRGESIIGVASLLTDEDNPARAEHGLTAVVREERGRGIASALKRQCLHWAASNGISEVYTWTQQYNEDMRRLNERLGFSYGLVSVTLEAPLPLLRRPS
ncbi:GNAT family N-acetyltransferase [Catelliglobosispora koreensis]|uniref:GNAT family N-acetyltransferase n=1 Tax=Catelliglobosispora koreensis TaxID=129052 RepID=UPI0003646331|nr:GNAT family N-acetyltransferase [Catelliglobosispora koreensis]